MHGLKGKNGGWLVRVVGTCSHGSQLWCLQNIWFRIIHKHSHWVHHEKCPIVTSIDVC